MHQEKKNCLFLNFFIFVHKNVYRIRFQKIKIGPWEGFEKKAFFSLFLMRKRLSSGQKWFLRLYFPLIRGMFVFRSGLRFSFRALEMPEPRVRKKSFSLTKIFINHVSKALDQIVSYWQFQAMINENHFNKTLIIRRIYSCVINVVNSCPPPLALVTSCALD